jgi:hypothetical protein
MTAADYAALEAREAELEHQFRNVLTYKVDAVSHGVSVMHGEMTEQFGEVRERLGRLELAQERASERLGSLELGQGRIGERLDGHERRFDAIDRRLDSHGEMLTEILRRLPRGPINGPSGGQDDH